MPTKILVILGPTATGKSTLAVKIAKEITRHKWGGFKGAEIISADSRQVYKGLDIGTGKITQKEMRAVPHHLLDVASPKRQFNVAQFVKLADRAAADIVRRGKTPIICGGTGFYIDALLRKIPLPNVPPNATLRKKLTKKTASELFLILQKRDPIRAETIDRKNPRRLIRAIEIAYANKSPHLPRILRGSATGVNECRRNSSRGIQYPTGRWEDKSANPTSPTLSKSGPIFIGLCPPKNELRRRVRSRLSARMRQGMIAEVIRLHRNGLSFSRMKKLGLEYRYLALFLENKISKNELITKLETEIYRYAKRQITWFKRDKNIHWFWPPKKLKPIVLKKLIETNFS